MIPIFLQILLPILANILFILSVMINLVGPLLASRKKTKRDIASLITSNQNVKESDSSIESTIAIRYRRLEQYYKIMRNQTLSWFIFSVILFSVGILVISVSLIIPSYINMYLYIQQEHNVVQIVILIFGAILNIIAIGFFLRTRQASQEIDRYCNEKFLEAEELSQLVKLVSQNPNTDARNHFKEKIILQLLIPMREKEITVNKL